LKNSLPLIGKGPHFEERLCQNWVNILKEKKEKKKKRKEEKKE